MLTLRTVVTSLIPPRLRPRAIARRRLERVTRERIVLSGPFAGMRYVNQSVGSMWWPKLLGTYELELAGIVRELCLSRPPVLIDVGAAEGYYAVGIAWCCSATRVTAFEAEPEGRVLLAELAALNGVSHRVRIEGFCDHAALADAMANEKCGLIICDVEGGERALLDPRIVPALVAGQWTLLVEIHDHISADIADILIDRFARTHRIEEIVSRPRSFRELPATAQWRYLSRWTRTYMDEQRPGPMRWLLLRPKGS